MVKRIVSYVRDQGIIVECTDIQADEHQDARGEIVLFGFEFDSINTDSFYATLQCVNRPDILSALEKLGYSF